MSVLNMESEEKKYKFSQEENLLELLQRHGRMIESPCAGKGTCGKCKVKIMQGKIHAPMAEEIKLLTDEELSQGIRLSCLVNPSGDLTIKLLDDKDLKHKILADGYLPGFEINPLLSKKVYILIVLIT